MKCGFIRLKFYQHEFIMICALLLSLILFSFVVLYLLFRHNCYSVKYVCALSHEHGLHITPWCYKINIYLLTNKYSIECFKILDKFGLHSS